MRNPMMNASRSLSLSVVALLLTAACWTAHAADWQPAKGNLMTTWGEKVTPANAWTEYPRPQLVRENWTNLNGLWDYAVTPKEAAQPPQWAGKILVPFAIEAPLSGVGRMLAPEEALWYQRTLELTPAADRRTLLHFEAVDYQCTVTLNGKEVGSHTGGCTAFTCDLTEAAKAGANTLVVKVLDATGGFQLTGKQRMKPGGIWYTRCSGIWQTVWLEQVPARYIRDLDMEWDAGSSTLAVNAAAEGKAGAGETVRVIAGFGGKDVATASAAGPVKLTIPEPKLWSPAQPNLYDLRVELLDGAGKVVDSVKSYTGLRTVGKARDKDGHLRITLNGKPIFNWGPLDQGWWPDGLLTPPSDAAMRSDIEFLKAAGFNMIRKHIKVEPRRYYYHCDQIGIMMWQDQVSGGKSPKWTRFAPNPQDAEWPDDAHTQWLTEYRRMVDQLRDQPCIVCWVPFNEAWGQHRSVEVGQMAAAYDKSRLINIASGGNFWPVGDIADEHKYPHPGFPLGDARYKDYIKVVGEFGGHGFPVQEHLWNPNAKNWGYGGLPKNKEEWIDRYTNSIKMLADLKSKGVAAGVYTQTTDVEGEINGLLTYDRKVQKLPPEKLAEIHQALGVLEER